MNHNNLYEQDFNAWITQQIQLLQHGNIHEIDIPHLVEELQDMGKSYLNALESRFIVLIAHLLKWQYQLAILSEQWQTFQGNSWRSTIIEQRNQIARLLKKNPSLKSKLLAVLADTYPDAVEFAADETGFSPNVFPKNCPYTLEQLLDKQFYPAASH